MDIEISYADAKKRHPELVAEVMAKLRSGKSKDNKAAPSKLKWFYNWGECVQCDTFNDIMAKAAAQAHGEVPKVKPLEIQVQERIEQSFVGLFASIGRWKGHADSPVFNGPKSFHAGFQGKPPGKIPTEVKSIIVKLKKQDFKEQKRIAALTEEEKTAEIGSLLGKLRGTPGFVEVSIPMEIPSADGIQTIEGEPVKAVRPKGLTSFLKLYGAGGK